MRRYYSSKHLSLISFFKIFKQITMSNNADAYRVMF